MHTTTFTTNRELIEADSPFGIWMIWAALLVLGIISFGGISSAEESKQASLNRTETAATRVAGNIDNLISYSELGALGSEQGLLNAPDYRSKIQKDIAVLQQGGYLFENDKHPVKLHDSNKNFLNALNSSLNAFDAASQPVLGSTESLRQAIQAETLLISSLKSVNEFSIQLGQSVSFVSNPLGQAISPLRQDFAKTDPSSLSLVFSTNSNLSLAQQWVDLLKNRANDANRFKELIARDATISAMDKDRFNKFAQSVVVLASQSEILLRTMEIRKQAYNSIEPIQQASVELKKNAHSLSNAAQVDRAAGESNPLKWLALLISLIGLVGFVLSYMKLNNSYNAVRVSSIKGNQMTLAVERLSRNVKKSLSTGGQQDVLEPTDSPLYMLSSMISQLFNAVKSMSETVSDQNKILSSATETSDKSLSGALISQKDYQEKLKAIHANSNSYLEEIETVSNQVLTLMKLVDGLSSESLKGGSIAQESAWIMDQIRENTQAISKRIKRLGETTQTINTNVEVVKDLCKKIKVISVNMTLEAASMGNNGRIITALTQELDRLSENCDQALKDIDLKIEDIQNDAKETVKSMESGTADVVSCAKLTNNAGSQFVSIEELIKTLRGSASEALSKIEDVSIGIQEETKQISIMYQSLEGQAEKMDKVKTSFGLLKNISITFNKLLSNPFK